MNFVQWINGLLPRIKHLCCELRQLKQHGYGYSNFLGNTIHGDILLFI